MGFPNDYDSHLKASNDYDEGEAEKIQGNLDVLYNDVELLHRLIRRLEISIQEEKQKLASLCLLTQSGHNWTRDYDGYPCDGTIYQCTICYTVRRG